MIPAFRLALAFAGGIALANFLPANAAWISIGIVSAIGLGLVLVPVGLVRRGAIKGGGSLLLTMGLGLCLGVVSKPELVSLSAENPEHFVARIQSELTENANWFAADALIERIYFNDSWSEEEVKIRLFIARSEVESGFGKGSTIISKARINEVRAPLNPTTFNYKAFLNDQGIRYQTFIKDGEVELVAAAPPKTSLYILRDWIAHRLEMAIPTPAELAVMKALVLGDRSGLDDEIKDIYSRTGAIHVLAVSGLHTGVIAGIFIWILGFIKSNKLNLLKLLLFWSGLFAYVALTGFSPSVQRSAVMFGILFAGRLLRMDANPLNSLGLSAIIILAFNPQLLFSLGFQLSYSAVAGILAFYPTFKKWLGSSNYYLNFIGDLTAVSIAATIATAPLTTYYFHQFPLYFILSGLFAVPLVSLALPTAIFGLVTDGLFSLIGSSAYWAYIPSYLFVWMCNASLEWIAHLPATLLDALWPSKASVWFSYLTICLLGAGFLRKKNWQLVMASVGFLAVGLSIYISNYQKRQLEEVRIYASRGETSIDIIGNGLYNQLTTVLSMEETTLSDKLSEEMMLYRESLNLSQATSENLEGNRVYAVGDYQFFSAKGITWVVLPDTIKTLPIGAPTVDYVIARNPKKISPSALDLAFPKSIILLANYIPSWLQGDWDPLMDRIHVLPQDGSIVLRDVN